MPISSVIPFPNLMTERLILRQLQNSDADNIFSLRSDRRVNLYIDRPKIIFLDDAKTFITKINEGISKGEWLYWAITINMDKNLAGTICLWNIFEHSNSAEIGYELHPDYQGKGYASEALHKIIEFGFSKMKLGVLNAYTHMENQNSIHLLQKFNFTRAGKNEMNLKEVVYQLTNNPKRVRL